MENKKKLLFVSSAIWAGIICAFLGFIIKSFLFSVISHMVFRCIAVLIIVLIFRFVFKERLNNIPRKAIIWCEIALVLDLVVLDVIRFVLDGGVSTVLFFPACLPFCFMVIMLFLAKDSAKKKRESTITLLLGIPLLLISIYFETYSFI